MLLLALFSSWFPFLSHRNWKGGVPDSIIQLTTVLPLILTFDGKLKSVIFGLTEEIDYSRGRDIQLDTHNWTLVEKRLESKQSTRGMESYSFGQWRGSVVDFEGQEKQVKRDWGVEKRLILTKTLRLKWERVKQVVYKSKYRSILPDTWRVKALSILLSCPFSAVHLYWPAFFLDTWFKMISW